MLWLLLLLLLLMALLLRRVVIPSAFTSPATISSEIVALTTAPGAANARKHRRVLVKIMLEGVDAKREKRRGGKKNPAITGHRSLALAPGRGGGS